MTEAVEPLAPGAAISAVFPRMMGKRRPGVVLCARGAAEILAVPITSHRTNQLGRIEIGPDPSLGLARRSWLLVPMAQRLPHARIDPLPGHVSEDRLAALVAEVARWFGPDWRDRVGRARPRLRKAPRPR